MTRAQRRAHRRIWLLLALLLPGILLAAALLRAQHPAPEAPQRIAPP